MSGDLRTSSHSSHSLINISTSPTSACTTASPNKLQQSTHHSPSQRPSGERHFESSETIRDIVIGMSDGLTVPFALAAGMTGAVGDTRIISMAGLVEIVGGSLAMSLGGYLAGKTEVEHYEMEYERECQEIETCPDLERQEVIDVFHEFGLSEMHTNAIADAIVQDKKKWVDFMMKFELELKKPAPNRARDSGLTIGLSYFLGGFVPLSPYFLLSDATQALIFSVFITLATLFTLGYLKSKATGMKNPIQGAIKVMLIGAVAATAAYLVARFFQPDRTVREESS